MRPYFAIIKDSFREALASRVLWVLLALITMKLVFLAPLGIKLNLTTEFAPGDIQNGPLLAEKIYRASVDREPSPGKRVWGLLDQTSRDKLVRLSRVEAGDGQEFFQGTQALRAELNKLLKRPDLYDADAWDLAALPKEARDLVARPRKELKDDELARMNRLLLEEVSPGSFRRRSPHSVSLTYFFGAMDLFGPLPVSEEQARRVLDEWLISGSMSLLVGVAGVIAAILVTSTIIPQMFEPGSINLLLSKPISRSLLFLSKFLGGCAFILLNVAYLIVGLWLILGARFGVWNQGMLWCIPIFLFLFLIYYAVSAFTGLVWKSAVISVVVTVMFWASCWVVGTTKTVMEALLLDQRRITRLIDAEGDLLSATEEGSLQLWQDGSPGEWQEVFEPDGRGGGAPTLDGPYFHEPTKQVLLGQGFRDPFGFAGRRITLRVGRAESGWQFREGPALPSGTSTFLVLPDNSVLAVASDNVFRLRGQPVAAAPKMKVFGIPLSLGAPRFEPVLAESKGFPDPVAAAADPTGPRAVICSGNEVTLLARRDSGEFAVAAQRTLTGDDKQGAAVAMAGEAVLIAREDGKVWLLSADDLTVRKEMTLESRTQPRFALASHDGKRIGVLFQNRKLWLVDAESGEARRAPVSGQGDISGFAFAPGKLLVADRVHRVTEYDGDMLERKRVRWPRMNRVELTYYYAIQPIYAVFPKPGELDNTVHYLLTGKRTTDAGLFRGDVTQRREDLHPWRPVRSGLVFVGVMLLISCLYLERHEF